MFWRKSWLELIILIFLGNSSLAGPVIDPLANLTLPAGNSYILPITAVSTNGRPLTYTITSSTNAIAVVMHTNNPFWQLTIAQTAATNAPGAYRTPYRGGLVTVTNVGTLTFMLFPEYAPHTVNIFQGLTSSGFYNSNTIFHRVISNFIIQGGDPLTNGMGGLVFNYDDEYHPQATFSGTGQLALANSGKDTDGSQFFVTLGPQRFLDFGYPIFGQLVRGFNVLTNISNTTVDANSRPLADEIIQTTAYATNTSDTVVTLTATNISGVTGKITVIADDGIGGRTTNTFNATTVTDIEANYNAFIYPGNSVTNLVAPINTTITNFLTAVELTGKPLYWYGKFPDKQSLNAARNSGLYFTNCNYRAGTYNVTNLNGRMQLNIVPATNYVGPVYIYFDVSYSTNLDTYDEQAYLFVIGDTLIVGQSNNVSTLVGVPTANAILATFTNGVPASAATNFAAYINWGDNSITDGNVTASTNGFKAVLGSHTYTYPGSYPVYVTVQSTIGAIATILSYVNVTNTTTPATNLLTTRVTGLGTVSPAFTNAPLAVGGNYNISASPATFWVFSNWTDGNGFILGNSPNLNFTMSPGLSLTANFVPAVAPALTVLTPANGQLLTNLYSNPAIMTGTAANNATVTNVWFQLNGGTWQSATGTTNWTASFTPAYGTSNILRAYAVNNYGYLSPTSTVQVKYLAGDVLNYKISGLGSIAPNLNQALLPLGSNYVLTATPASGFTFTSWTGRFPTNQPVLSFNMTTNVTVSANFANKTAPTVTITTPTSGQRTSNGVFTLTGTATNNWAVSNVLFSLNNSGWTNATTTNSWANWTAQTALVPGTNTVAVYGVDPNGLASLTNIVAFQFVVTNLLQIRATGLGTLAPNYVNAWLEAGRNYTITATPAAGFAATSWQVATNFTGGYATNNATVQFLMASNLTLQINFTETNRPTLAIVWPTAGLVLSNALPAVIGTASDAWGVTGVWYQLNKGPWTAPVTTNAWTNWNVTLKMVAGSNTVSAYALNLGGIYSLTNTVSVFSSNTFKLLLNMANSNPTLANGFTFSLLPSTNLYGHIEYSTNLSAWNFLTNFAGTNSTLNFRDPAATNTGGRYYRAVIP